MHYFKSGIGAVFIALSAVSRGQIVLQPNELQSKDAKAYSFVSDLNLQSNIGVVGSGAAPHSFKSLIQFDLTAIPYTATEISLATLAIYCSVISPIPDANSVPIPGSGPGNVSLFPVTGSWTEAGVTWANFPTYQATAADSEMISTAGQWYTFDITDVVKTWSAGSFANNGLAIIMDSEFGQVTLLDSDGLTGATPNPALAPRLTVVPEPSAALLGLFGFGACGIRRIRQRHSS
jgi:hypothetical protein